MQPTSLAAARREEFRPKNFKDMREVGTVRDALEGQSVDLKKEHGDEPTAGLLLCAGSGGAFYLGQFRLRPSSCST